LKVVEVKENLVKRLLHNIFGIIRTIRDSLRHGKNSSSVTKNQLFERPRIPALCGSHQDAVGVFVHTTLAKLFHNSQPPRDLSKRQTTVNKAKVTPKAVSDRTGWEMAEATGDGSFQRILGSAGACANLSGYWQSVSSTGMLGMSKSTRLSARPGGCDRSRVRPNVKILIA
jgi:hypothetical protein